MSRRTYNLHGFENWLVENFYKGVGVPERVEQCPISRFIRTHISTEAGTALTFRTTVVVGGIVYNLPKHARRFVVYLDSRYSCNKPVSGRLALRAWWITACPSKN